MPPAELGLAQRWRDEAALLRRRAASPPGRSAGSCAAEVEACSKERDIEALTLSQAAAESGFTYSALGKWCAGAPSRMWEGGVRHGPSTDLPRRANPADGSWRLTSLRACLGDKACLFVHLVTLL